MNGTVSDTEQEKHEVEVRMTKIASLLAGYFMVTVVAVGFVVNVVVINTFRRHPGTLPAECRMLRFLFCCDSMTAVLSYPFTCASLIANKWLFSDIGCQWYGFSMTVAGLSTIASYACIAFQRFNIVVRMRRDMESVSVKRARNTSVIVMMYAIIIGLLPFFGVGSYGFEPRFWSCAPIWWSEEKNDFVFIIILFVFAFFLPLSLIIFSYVAISIKVFKSTTNKPTNRGHGLKIVAIFFLMILSFLLSWGPYTVVAFLHAFGRGFVITPMMNIVPLMMAKSYILWDPLIYLGGNEKFRQALLGDIITFSQTVLNKCSNCHCKSSKAFTVQSHMPREALNVANVPLHLNETATCSNNPTSSYPSIPMIINEHNNTDELDVMGDECLICLVNPILRIETTVL